MTKKKIIALLALSYCWSLAPKNIDFSPVTHYINSSINEHIFPCCVVLINYRGTRVYHKAFGNFTYNKKSPKASVGTLFDLASLTKTIVTTTLAMDLCDHKKITLETPVSSFFKEFTEGEKNGITIRHLLLHRSGIGDLATSFNPALTHEQMVQVVLTAPLKAPVGQQYIYSCYNMIILQQIIEKITGKNLDTLAQNRIFRPLRMNMSMFNPPSAFKKRCAPTGDNPSPTLERTRIQGAVHDDNAYQLGGIAGNAGLFSTARDLERFMLAMLHPERQKIINAPTIIEWTRKQSVSDNRAYGWATPPDLHFSCGHYFSENSFGHLGFTGTSIWADRDRDLIVIVLTNRTYPQADSTNRIWNFRTTVHDLIIKSLEDKDTYET